MRSPRNILGNMVNNTYKWHGISFGPTELNITNVGCTYLDIADKLDSFLSILEFGNVYQYADFSGVVRNFYPFSSHIVAVCTDQPLCISHLDNTCKYKTIQEGDSSVTREVALY